MILGCRETFRRGGLFDALDEVVKNLNLAIINRILRNKLNAIRSCPEQVTPLLSAPVSYTLSRTQLRQSHNDLCGPTLTSHIHVAGASPFNLY